MGSHRASTAANRSTPDEATPYVGKRARRDVVTEPSETVATAETAVEALSMDLAADLTAEWQLFAAVSPEDTGALPYALTEDFTGSLPKITDEMLYGAPGTDLSGDTTTALPAVRTGKRRAAKTEKRTLLQRVPSLPALVGVGALAIAGFGAVTSGATDMVRVDAGTLRQAGALSGTSAVAVVGSAREASLSRDTNRGADAETTATRMAKARTSLAAQAENQSDELRKNQWQTPVTPGVYRLTARFGDSGLWANRHTGLDFAAPQGTPIHAVANGVITSAGWDGAYGNKTVETLDDGTELWYAHQVKFGVTPGETVHAGQVIGYVGATGHVTGPHVHLEVRPGGGDPVDPYAALVAQGVNP